MSIYRLRDLKSRAATGENRNAEPGKGGMEAGGLKGSPAIKNFKRGCILAPLRITPPNSCAVPGRKPGTSTKVRIGMLKQSQKRMKRAPLIEESMSRTPA